MSHLPEIVTIITSLGLNHREDSLGHELYY